MNTALPLLLIGLVFGGGIGFTIAAANGVVLNGHDHSNPAHHGASVDARHARQQLALAELPEGMTRADICRSTDAAETSAHTHQEVLVIAPSPTAPALTLEISKDAVSGWNLHIETENFAFSPQNASGGHVDGEGHAHVYINGLKLGRYYGNWVHLDNLPDGEVVVEVTLNANDHRPLAVGTEKLAARVTLQN